VARPPILSGGAGCGYAQSPHSGAPPPTPPTTHPPNNKPQDL
jgi:hypothetical protein